MTDLITIDAAKAGAKFAMAVRQARALMADVHDDIVMDLMQVEAERLIVQGFIRPAIERVPLAYMRDRLEDEITERFWLDHR